MKHIDPDVFEAHLRTMVTLTSPTPFLQHILTQRYKTINTISRYMLTSLVCLYGSMDIDVYVAI